MTESVDLKVVLLGSVGVGKTCLSVRYIFGTFGAVNSTVGASFQQRKVREKAVDSSRTSSDSSHCQSITLCPGGTSRWVVDTRWNLGYSWCREV